MQAEYKAVRGDASELQLINAKLKEQVTALSDSERHLQLQLNKLTQANAVLEEVSYLQKRFQSRGRVVASSWNNPIIIIRVNDWV